MRPEIGTVVTHNEQCYARAGRAPRKGEMARPPIETHPHGSIHLCGDEVCCKAAGCEALLPVPCRVEGYHYLVRDGKLVVEKPAGDKPWLAHFEPGQPESWSTCGYDHEVCDIALDQPRFILVPEASEPPAEQLTVYASVMRAVNQRDEARRQRDAAIHESEELLKSYRIRDDALIKARRQRDEANLAARVYGVHADKAEAKHDEYAALLKKWLNWYLLRKSLRDVPPPWEETKLAVNFVPPQPSPPPREPLAPAAPAPFSCSSTSYTETPDHPQFPRLYVDGDRLATEPPPSAPPREAGGRRRVDWPMNTGVFGHRVILRDWDGTERRRSSADQRTDAKTRDWFTKVFGEVTDKERKRTLELFAREGYRAGAEHAKKGGK